MQPKETFRVSCGECQGAFDITIAQRDEWRELPNDENEPDTECRLQDDVACPFCGTPGLTLQADLPTYI